MKTKIDGLSSPNQIFDKYKSSQQLIRLEKESQIKGIIQQQMSKEKQQISKQCQFHVQKASLEKNNSLVPEKLQLPQLFVSEDQPNYLSNIFEFQNVILQNCNKYNYPPHSLNEQDHVLQKSTKKQFVLQIDNSLSSIGQEQFMLHQKGEKYPSILSQIYEIETLKAISSFSLKLASDGSYFLNNGEEKTKSKVSPQQQQTTYLDDQGFSQHKKTSKQFYKQRSKKREKPTYFLRRFKSSIIEHQDEKKSDDCQQYQNELYSHKKMKELRLQSAKLQEDQEKLLIIIERMHSKNLQFNSRVKSLEHHLWLQLRRNEQMRQKIQSSLQKRQQLEDQSQNYKRVNSKLKIYEIILSEQKNQLYELRMMNLELRQKYKQNYIHEKETQESDSEQKGLFKELQQCLQQNQSQKVLISELSQKLNKQCQKAFQAKLQEQILGSRINKLESQVFNINTLLKNLKDKSRALQKQNSQLSGICRQYKQQLLEERTINSNLQEQISSLVRQLERSQEQKRQFQHENLQKNKLIKNFQLKQRQLQTQVQKQKQINLEKNNHKIRSNIVNYRSSNDMSCVKFYKQILEIFQIPCSVISYKQHESLLSQIREFQHKMSLMLDKVHDLEEKIGFMIRDIEYHSQMNISLTTLLDEANEKLMVSEIQRIERKLNIWKK